MNKIENVGATRRNVGFRSDCCTWKNDDGSFKKSDWSVFTKLKLRESIAMLKLEDTPQLLNPSIYGPHMGAYKREHSLTLQKQM